jgi:hypothetical protein
MVRLFRTLVILAAVFVVLLFFHPDALVTAGDALKAVGSSKASGTAHMLLDQAGKAVNLHVDVQGLTLHLDYIVTLNEGQCDGKVLATLGKVTPDAQGHVQTTLSYKDLSAVQQSGSVWVNVHQGDASGPSVVCGQVRLENTASGQPQADTSVSGNGKNQSVQGFAPTTVTNLPKTGVAPANTDSYDNYTYPRRH